MKTIKTFCQPKFILAALLLALLASLIMVSAGRHNAMAAGTGPCDIYASGGTPCVAAHSTIRALYGSYSGNLYQVRRSSDNTTRNIGVLSAGGVANSAAQDSFCSGTSCVVTVLYDQSGHGNDLWYQGSGSPVGGADTPASATTESLTVSGNKVYSLYINPHNSYWRDGHLTGIPTGSAPEGMYMVTSGTHYNSGCCFDYGNSETNRKANGAGHMDAIYFGSSCWFGGCSGSGPWVQADLEYGLFPGGSSSWNPNQRAFTNRYVTAMLKNNGTTNFAIKGANAQSGSLTTLYSGSLPSGYNPMRKEGAIVLGSGGDCCATNQNDSAGTFYEGAMVSGMPSDATENSIQANIVAAGYGSTITPTTVPPTNVPPTNVPPTNVPPNGTVSINAGGSATGSFVADQYFSGGSTYTNTRTINMSQITTNPPPAAIFSTERYGAMTYTLPNRSGAQTVTLYFAETYVTAAGQRLFNVTLNGAAVLSNFDIYASAGGADRAIARSFSTTANSSGQVVIQFSAVTENPKINGITVTAGGVNPTQVPPTGVPPTGVPPTGVPPTGVPPTGVPPTGVPPTGVPPTSGPGACSPVTSTISVPFTFDGAGTFCWQTNNLGSYINSWNLASLTVNGVDFTNRWAGSGSYPPSINGSWYIKYTGNFAWSHFEAR